MNELFFSALAWVLQGFAVLPINWRAKTPEARLLKNGSWEYLQQELPTEADLMRWFPGRLHNLGLVMGWQNLVVVDFDNMDAYTTWRAFNQVQTYEVKTARGMHCYFRIDEPVNNSHSELLDIKAHGYVLVPPSIHPSGYQYSQYTNHPIALAQRLTDVLPDAFIPAPPQPTEFTPLPLVLGKMDWNALDNPLDPGADMIQQIRERVSILSVIPGATKTSGSGQWYTALCPFHDDHHPSFWIDLRRGICGCRACGMKPMDVINLFARLHGLSNRDAIFQLAKGVL